MLILASQSQARKSLLQGAGLRFAVRPPVIDERAMETEALAAGADGRQVALLLAEAKARAIAAAAPEAVVIGADQTLSLGYELLHKPGTLLEAHRQLERLRGKTHRLHAGVALAVGGEIVWAEVETAELTLRNFEPEECDEVLALEGDAVLGSVGGYRLEGPSIRLFEAVRGDYFTILGLPLLPLLAALRLYAPDVLSSERA
ncbi:MAG: Maf family protein [Devosia sp.]|nr:Maf family protein [Devosia sp.]